MIAAPVSAWTDLGAGVVVRQSRAFHMNSAVLLAEDHALLVDPGVHPDEIDDIAAVVAAISPQKITLVFTHAHWDHVMGRPWWPRADVLAHDTFAAALAAGRDHVVEEAEQLVAGTGAAWPGAFTPFAPDVAVSGQRFLKLGDWRLVLRDAFGHSDSQISVHLPELGLLLSADMLSDVEIPILNRQAEVYRRTLDTLAPLIEGGAIESLVPGHGSIARGSAAVRERLARDLRYFERLERGVRAAHTRGEDVERAVAALSPWDDVERHPAYAMREIHEANVRFAYAGIAAGG